MQRKKQAQKMSRASDTRARSSARFAPVLRTCTRPREKTKSADQGRVASLGKPASDDWETSWR